ncbi:MAG: MotA/TolQ/ExbB proton channel family protein [Nitrospina sp.]|nr:MotA/TolQ/ExbB proton channel family protein [Nitrospina sp.]
MIETFLSGIELMGKGGIMMFPIFLASIIAFAIIIERLIFFKKSKENPDEILKTIKNLVDNKNPPTTESSQVNEGPISRMLAVGAQAQKEPLWKVEEKLAVSGREEIQGLRKNLRGLEVIATISPLMGLLGTVMGMVKAFNKVAQYKGQVDPSLLAGGIWEALLTTAAGLAIAIPIVIMLNYFERKVESITILLEKYGQYLIHHLHEEQSESTKGNSPSAAKPGASPELTEQRV